MIDDLRKSSPRLRGFVGWGLAQAGRHKALSAATLFAMLVQVATGMTIPLALKAILDDVIPNHDLHSLKTTAALMGLGAILFLLSRLAQDYLVATLGARILGALRFAFFERIQSASMSFFGRVDPVDITSRFGPDLRELEVAVTAALSGLARQSLKVAINGTILFAIDWRLALATWVAVGLVLVAPQDLLRRAQVAEGHRQNAQASVFKVLQENVDAHFIVRAFHLQRHRIEQLQIVLQNLTARTVRSSVLSSLVSRLAGTGITVVEIGALAAGAWLVLRGDLTIGLLMTFIGLLGNAARAGQAITEVVPLATRGSVSLDRVQRMMAEAPVVETPADARPLAPFESKIHVDDVTFSYDGKHPNLRSVSLEIQAGSNVAFVGPSGSGKSTLLALILRLHDPGSGAVRIDGQDLRSTTEASLREQMTVVFQSPGLFDATIRDNIRAGRLGASDEEVEVAAGQAEIHEDILALPDGYETRVGRQNLSGGQRQRVAVARALLRAPRILLLDEATSALDPGTEHELNRTLERLSVGRTVISVTHRLQSVVRCDEIFVLEGGRLVEQGSHATLLSRDGPYRRLWNKQSGFVVSPAGDDAQVTQERLRQIPFLDQVDGAVLDRLAASLVPERFDAGDVVFEQGSVGDRFYVIVRGRFEAVIPGPDGQLDRLSLMEDGDYFGEIAIVEKVPRTTTVRALQSSLCLSLGQAAFARLLEDAPQLEDQLRQTIAERLVRSQQNGRPATPVQP